MPKKMHRYPIPIANVLTCLRIAGAGGLMAFSPGSKGFLTLYLFCGGTDLMDGPAARHWGTAGQRGALLDSVADLCFCGAALFQLVPVLLPVLPPWCLYAAGGVAAVKLSGYAIGFARFGGAVMLHTHLNKLVGGVLFFVPCLPFLWPYPGLWAALCAVSGVAAMEEFACQLLMKERDANLPGLLSLLKSGAASRAAHRP